jgi:hypothetical protein
LHALYADGDQRRLFHVPRSHPNPCAAFNYEGNVILVLPTIRT